jgi:hypothetical protein
MITTIIFSKQDLVLTTPFLFQEVKTKRNIILQPLILRMRGSLRTLITEDIVSEQILTRPSATRSALT